MNTTQAFYHLRRHHYAWPSGYPMFAVMQDGAALCVNCISDRSNPILVGADRSAGEDPGWTFAAAAVNWEDADLHCDHCSGRIESAYAD